MVYNDHSNKTTLASTYVPDKYIRTYDLPLFMRPITISLDAETWEMAKDKTNFSQWVRDSLRSERNKRSNNAIRAGKIEQITKISTAELLYQLEQRSEAEINALVSILRGSLPQQ